MHGVPRITRGVLLMTTGMRIAGGECAYLCITNIRGDTLGLPPLMAISPGKSLPPHASDNVPWEFDMSSGPSTIQILMGYHTQYTISALRIVRNVSASRFRIVGSMRTV